MGRVPLPEDLEPLDRLANWCIGVLASIVVGAFFVGAFLLSVTHNVGITPIAVLGASGSAVAALTSALNRYANGFERDDGTFFPTTLKEGTEKFNRRFSRWLLIRPLLGAVIAPVFVWGLSRLTKTPDEFLKSTEMLGFTSFMGGLLAKSVIDLIKNLFKNVFRA